MDLTEAWVSSADQGFEHGSGAADDPAFGTDNAAPAAAGADETSTTGATAENVELPGTSSDISTPPTNTPKERKEDIVMEPDPGN